MKIHERIKDVRKNSKLSQAEFGSRLGVSRDAVNNVENRRVEPTDILIKSICYEFSVNEDWLRTGEGQMFPDKNDLSLEAAMKIFNELDPEYREYALQHIHSVLDMQKRQNAKQENKSEE